MNRGRVITYENISAQGYFDDVEMPRRIRLFLGDHGVCPLDVVERGPQCGLTIHDMFRLLLSEFVFTVPELRLLAAEFAEFGLWRYEHSFPDDLRLRRSIEALRRYVLGEIDMDTLRMARATCRDAENEAETIGRHREARLAAVFQLLLSTQMPGIAHAAVTWGMTRYAPGRSFRFLDRVVRGRLDLYEHGRALTSTKATTPSNATQLAFTFYD